MVCPKFRIKNARAIVLLLLLYDCKLDIHDAHGKTPKISQRVSDVIDKATATWQQEIELVLFQNVVA